MAKDSEILEEILKEDKHTNNNGGGHTETKGRNVLTRKVERELIASTRVVDTENGERVVITTESGKELWATPKQVPADAEEVRFRSVKKGDTYKYAGEERIVKEDSAWFVGAGRQTIKAYSAMELQDAKIKAVMAGMAEFGLTNALNL